MSKKKSCRTCRFLRAPEQDRDGKIRYRAANAYLCRYVVPWPSLPASMRGITRERLPSPGWVEIHEGEDCPVWERAT
jgi:hypothetical protein